MALQKPDSGGGLTQPGTVIQDPYAPAGAPGGPQQPSPYDYTNDPILQKILAYDAAQRANAQAAATAARKALAIQFGDAQGFVNDEGTAAAAKNNPYSILANLKRGYDQTVLNHGEQINKGNLWYSGFHAKTAADDATGYGGQQYDARQQALGQLSNINQSLAQQLGGFDQSDIAAQGDAAARAQQQATAYGYDPGVGTPAGSGSPVQSAFAATGAGAGAGGFVTGGSSPLIRQLSRSLLNPTPKPAVQVPGPYIGTLR